LRTEIENDKKFEFNKAGILLEIKEEKEKLLLEWIYFLFTKEFIVFSSGRNERNEIILSKHKYSLLFWEVKSLFLILFLLFKPT
jgi:hypothetical protein